MDVETPARMPVMGDSSLLYSIFRNILDNAIGYSGGNMITIKATTDCTQQSTIGLSPSNRALSEQSQISCYHFTIADNGIGVSAEHLPHLFERFYRVDKGRSRELGGTGLGLAIVKNAVLLHGGTISASTASPHGLAVTFTLPNLQ